MRKQETGGEGRLCILPPQADDRAPGAVRVVVDAADLSLLPVEKLELLADVLAFRNEADFLNEGE